MTELSAVAGVLLLIAIAIYQAVLALGAPLGEPSFSAHPGSGDKVLLPSYHVVSGASALLVVLAAWVLAAQGGLVDERGLSGSLLASLSWFIGAYLVVDTYLNLRVSTSATKRWVGGAAKVTTAVCCAVVAINPG